MGRPEIVYLTEPIELSGVKIHHSYDGLAYLIDHYQHILSFPVNEQKIKGEHRQHIETLIKTYNFHRQLYEHERASQTNVPSMVVPTDQANDNTKEEVPSNVEQLHPSGDGATGG